MKKKKNNLNSSNSKMTKQVCLNWWSMLIRGILALTLAVLVLVWPQTTLSLLIILIAAYLLMEGILSLAVAFKTKWSIFAFFGIINILVSIIIIISPQISALAILYLIAAWLIARGVFDIINAIYLRKLIKDEWIMIAGGILSIVLGALIIIFPNLLGAIFISVIISIGLLTCAIFSLILGLKLRKNLSICYEVE